jgi:hypothetical protein
MAKAVFVAGESMFPPLSLEPTFPSCFRIFSRLEVVSLHEQDRFDSMLREIGLSYGEVEIRHDVGAFLGFAGHPY